MTDPTLKVGDIVQMRVQTPMTPKEVSSWITVTYLGTRGKHRIVEMPDGTYFVCHEQIELRK